MESDGEAVPIWDILTNIKVITSMSASISHEGVPPHHFLSPFYLLIHSLTHLHPHFSGNIFGKYTCLFM